MCLAPIELKKNILTLNVEHWTQWTASLASHPQKNWPPSSLPPSSGTRKYSGNVNFCRSKMLCRKVFEFLTVNGGDRSNIFVLIGQDANAFDALTRIYVKAASSIKIFRNHCILKPNFFFFFFLKNWAFSGLFFFIFRLFNTQLTVYNNSSILINVCRWLDSNRGPLALEATALPTEPQPLPKFNWVPVIVVWLVQLGTPYLCSLIIMLVNYLVCEIHYL